MAVPPAAKSARVGGAKDGHPRAGSLGVAARRRAVAFSSWPRCRTRQLIAIVCSAGSLLQGWPLLPLSPFSHLVVHTIYNLLFLSHLDVALFLFFRELMKILANSCFFYTLPS